MEYRIYANPVGGLLSRIHGADGFVFCDKKSKPFEGCGLFKIVHTGLDKNKKQYSIAVPIMPIESKGIFSICSDVIAGRFEGNDNVCKIRLKNAYPDFEVCDIESLVRLCNKVGQSRVVTVANTPAACSGVDFEVADIYAFDREITTNRQVQIRYVNGEYAWVTPGWIYKNRDRLVNTEMQVLGSTADSMRIKFAHV